MNRSSSARGATGPTASSGYDAVASGEGAGAGSPGPRPAALGGAEGSLPPTTDRGVSLQGNHFSLGMDDSLQVAIHWLSFTIVGGKAAAEKLLAEKLEDVGGWSGCNLPHGGFGYRESVAGVFGIRIYHSEDREEAHVVICGSACDQLPCGVLVRFLFAAATGRIRLRRIDLAFDGLVNEDGSPVSPKALFEQVKADDSTLRTWANRSSLSCYESLADDGGETFYIGSRTSERMVRIYNRRGITRMELELKGDRAEKFPAQFANSTGFFGPIAVGVLRDFLDFVEPSDRPSTAPLQRWWAAMVARFERLTLRRAAKVVALDERWQWLKRQVSASLLVIVKACGGDADSMLASLLAEGERRYSGKHNALLATVPAGWQLT